MSRFSLEVPVQEKRALGKIWQEGSAGGCLFIMPNGKDFHAISAKITSNFYSSFFGILKAEDIS
jgi:hypothetical protein